MRVWITRTEPGATRQARELEAAGHACVVAPVLAIEPLPGPAPQGPFDVVVFLSEHAVIHGLPHLAAALAGWSVELLAVGARTAHALAVAGWPAENPSRADSEGLLGLPQLADVSGRRILLVCGADGRMLLAGELAARGAAVTRFVCYRRCEITRAGPEVDGVDAIVAGSASGLGCVANLWLRSGRSRDVLVLTPSERVRRHGVALGFRNVHDCGGADTAAVLRALRNPAGTDSP